MKRTSYRPTVEDMVGSGKWQSLSCRAAGQFDKKFQIFDGHKTVVDRKVVTGWERVCRTRRQKGGANATVA